MAFKDMDSLIEGVESKALSRVDQALKGMISSKLKGKSLAKSKAGKMVLHGAEAMAAKGMKLATKALMGRIDPDTVFTFRVEIDGIMSASFRSASGLEWAMEVQSFYQGGENTHKVNLIGKGNFTPLKLKKGFFSATSEFFNWMKFLMNPGGSSIHRATISLVILADDGSTEVGRFNLYNAFMSKYTGPAMDASQNDIAFEEVEIHYDYFEYVPGSGFMAMAKKTLGALR